MEWRFFAEARPRLQVAGRYLLDDKNFAARYNAPTAALHLYEYAGTIRFADRQFPLQPGDLTLSPPGMDTFYDLPRPGFHLCLHFLPPVRGKTQATMPLHVRPGSHALRLSRKMQEVITLFHGAPESAALRAELILQEFLLDLATTASASPRIVDGQTTTAPEPADKIALAAGLLRAELHRNLTVALLARQTELSQNYLARQFRARYGLTMQQFRMRARMEYAAFLLTTTTLTVRQAGARVGISDPQHFNKLFRRFAGCCPLRFRQDHTPPVNSRR